VPHCKSNKYNWFFFFVHVCNKLYTFSMPHLSLFHLVEREELYVFLSLPFGLQLDFSPVVVCLAMLSMLLKSRLQTHRLH